jgi:hypothetical protein
MTHVADPREAALRRNVDSVFAVLALGASFALPLTWAFRPVVDPDIWWHLAAGRWMFDHRTVPSVDPFMTGGVSREWLNYSWLIDVLLWLGYRVAELAAPVSYSMCMAGLLLLVCAALVRRDGSRIVRRSFAAAVGFLSISTQLGPRTYLFSALFTGLTLLFVRGYLRGAGPRRGYWLIPMFALWANVHIEFIYGFFFLGLATFDRWLKRLDPDTRADRSWKPLALLTALSLAATAMNPFGVHLHAMILRMIGPYTANDLVSEMQANSFRSPIDYLVLPLFGSAVFTLAQRRARDVYSWGSLVVSAYMGFHSQRITWLLSFVALDILGDHALFSGGKGASEAPRLFRLSLPAVVGVTIVVVTAALVQARERLAPRALLPYAAASFARDRGLRGPLYNDWNWGGFFRFELPEVPGNIDGRGPIFGPELPGSTLNTWRGKPEWRTDPDLDRAGFVIANARSALAQLLPYDPRFKKVFEDEMAVVFVREAN